MTDETQMTKAELLANIEQGWNNFQAYLASLSYEQVTTPTDPAGWTAKDHIAHVAIWEDSLNALLEKKSRREHMGIDDLAAWKDGDWDAINAIIQQRYHDLPLRDLATLFFGIHKKLVGKINALSDADLQRSYQEFQPDSDWDAPIIHWMIIDTYEHYDEHKDYIDIIARSRPHRPQRAGSDQGGLGCVEHVSRQPERPSVDRTNRRSGLDGQGSRHPPRHLGGRDLCAAGASDAHQTHGH